MGEFYVVVETYYMNVRMGPFDIFVIFTIITIVINRTNVTKINAIPLCGRYIVVSWRFSTGRSGNFLLELNSIITGIKIVINEISVDLTVIDDWFGFDAVK